MCQEVTELRKRGVPIWGLSPPCSELAWPRLEAGTPPVGRQGHPPAACVLATIIKLREAHPPSSCFALRSKANGGRATNAKIFQRDLSAKVKGACRQTGKHFDVGRTIFWVVLIERIPRSLLRGYHLKEELEKQWVSRLQDSTLIPRSLQTGSNKAQKTLNLSTKIITFIVENYIKTWYNHL